MGNTSFGPALAVVLLAAAPLTAATITVDRTDDIAAASACTGAANDCSLRGAVIYANSHPGTTISVPAGTYQLTIDGSSEGGNCLDATIGDLDIAGNNTTIQGAGAAVTIIQQTKPNDRVLCADQNLAGNFNFTIRDVTIAGGRETFGVGGGGIISGYTGDVTTVTNVVFVNNQASGGGSPVGGGLANGAGTLTVSGSTFGGASTSCAGQSSLDCPNQSTASGGGIYYSANGGAGSFTLTTSVFRNNKSPGGDGGALKATSTSTPYQISDTVFAGNSAGATGGAVCNESGTMNLLRCTFTGNQVTAAAGRGGAVGSVDGAGHNITMTYCRLVGNTAATPANGNQIYGGSGSAFTANDDWWGVNTGPAANDRAGTTTVTNYLKLTNTPSPATIYGTGPSTLTPHAAALTAGFLADSAGNTIAAANLTALTGLPVTWGNAVLGSLSATQTTIQASGTATATFTAGSGGGAGHADATVDSATATANLTVVGAATHLSVSAPASATSGVAISVTVTARDSANAATTNYAGTVHFTSGDPLAVLAANSTLTNGAGTFSATLNTAGSQTITATDTVTSSIAGTSGTIAVTCGTDTTPPAVTAPAPIVVDQTLCCGTFGGATGATSATLAAFLAGGSATDGCTASPTRLAPRVGGVDVTNTTCFAAGATTVTFRFQDGSGNTGTATSTATVRMFGDLNLDATVDPSDMVILRAYANSVVSPGTPPFAAPLAMADVNHDATVDPSDFTILRAYVNFVVGCLAP